MEYISSWAGFELTTLMVIGTDCTCSCKSNNHTIAVPKMLYMDWVVLCVYQFQLYLGVSFIDGGKPGIATSQWKNLSYLVVVFATGWKGTLAITDTNETGRSNYNKVFWLGPCCSSF